jgi:putative ATPase
VSNLFEAAGIAGASTKPLAERLRPKSLSEVVGQDDLLGENAPLTRMLKNGRLASLIFWGPPGCGKTTIARLLAVETDLEFVSLSAVFSGVADLRKAFDDARSRRELGRGTLLFVDEIHRFNRSNRTLSYLLWRKASLYWSGQPQKTHHSN